MKDSIHKYFKVGVVQWMIHPPARYDFMESLKVLACDDFFDAIEVGQIKDDKTREAAKQLLADSHMEVCYGVHTRIFGQKLNPNHIDEAERQKAETTLMESIDEALYLGAKGIVFPSGKWDPATKDQNYAQLLKTTRNVCDYAKTKGILVQLELFDSDMDKAVLIGPAPYAAKFAADMRTTHSNFGLCVDLSHFPTTYETSRFVVQMLRPYITHLHFGNAVVTEGCEAYGDVHPCFGYPNSAIGTAELLDFLRVLKEEGFFRADDPLVLSMEMQPRPGQDGDVILANTKRTLNRAWALLED